MMTQKGLISKILKTTGLEHSNPNYTPATQVALGSDPDGPPIKESWSYSSVVGMLIYLATNSRHDIAFATNQVSHFSANPNQSHAVAVKHLVRYLKAAPDKGATFILILNYLFECWIDSDFLGLHGREFLSAMSRTGLIATFCNCLLPSMVALSTMQAVLSEGMHTVIILQRLCCSSSYP
jgi:hypothetical protein